MQKQLLNFNYQVLFICGVGSVNYKIIKREWNKLNEKFWRGGLDIFESYDVVKKEYDRQMSYAHAQDVIYWMPNGEKRIQNGKYISVQDTTLLNIASLNDRKNIEWHKMVDIQTGCDVANTHLDLKCGVDTYKLAVKYYIDLVILQE